MSEQEELQAQLRQIVSLETMTSSDGWRLFLAHLKDEQAKYLKKARDKRSQFNGEKIALFMSCEGVLEGLQEWVARQIKDKDRVTAELTEIRNRESA